MEIEFIKKAFFVVGVSSKAPFFGKGSKISFLPRFRMFGFS